MGSLFGGALASSKHDVVLYDIYKDHVDAINRDRLVHRRCNDQGCEGSQAPASADPEAVKDSDVMIFFVKSINTEEAAATFKAYAKPETIAMTLQNGLGNEAILRKHFGPARTAAGVTSQGATFLGPGKIRHAGKGPTHIAMADGDQSKLAELAKSTERRRVSK